MAHTQRFRYRNLEELNEDIARRGLDLPVCDDLSVLAEEAPFGRWALPNRLGIHPMEGCDATADGAPSDLSVRRYRRFAAGGAGLIWFEATAVEARARANPRQLWLHDGTAEAFASMLEAARAAADETMGHRPVCVLQLTHSGRYSRPIDKPAPILAHHSAVLDPVQGLGPDYPLISDEELDALQDAFVHAAVLAAQIGFDAVDIKSCHRYLLSELLASFTRRNSRYGGSYENRTRMIRETAEKIRRAVGDRIDVTCRINVYDAIEYPYGWGVGRHDVNRVDLAEPIRLLGELRDLGFGAVNVTMGNPYFNPHVNRPADWTVAGWPEAPEHPLEGVARMVDGAREIQKALPELAVVASGYSWLRQYVPYFAAAAIRRGGASVVALGRGALAYPNFPRDILREGRMDPHRVCVACSSCTQIMRDRGRSGCVVRDNEVYAPIFKEGRRGDAAEVRALASKCRQCPDAMCVTRCPAGVDVPGFVGAVAAGDEYEAYRILQRANILPEICGLVCPVEVQCQSACIQSYIGEGAVSIAEIQQRLSHRAISAGWAALEIPDLCSGRRVAVVGAGPAGLAATAELILRGHRVTILDRTRRAGGKLGTVIPTVRLSAARAESEIRAIFKNAPADRLEWRLGTSLGPEFTLGDLAEEGFDAILLAFGLGNSATLAGAERPEGVLDAEAFLSQMNRHVDHQCPPRVAVVGGGNTAIDAASCASRRGARDVYLVYRRSYAQMPAWPNERAQALSEGVHLLVLCQPEGYVCDRAGRLTGLKITRTELGEADDSGRRSPQPIAESQFVLDVDLVVEAIGQQLSPAVAEVLADVALSESGLVLTIGESLATSRTGVWAAGDAVNGGTTVVQAVAEGRRAAEEIDAFLAGSSN